MLNCNYINSTIDKADLDRLNFQIITLSGCKIINTVTPLNWDKSPGTEWFPCIEANTKFHRLIGNSA